jgi:hypothetical protein
VIADNQDAWRAVPAAVARLVKVAGPLALELRAIEAAGDPEDRAWWDPPTGRVHVQSRRKQAAWRAALAPGVAVSAAEPAGDLWVLIKRASFLAPLEAGRQAAMRALGGPGPMSSAITGGLVGAGLGYGAGWLGEQLLPDEQFQPGRLRRSLAILGAGAGAVPPLWWASAVARSKNAMFAKAAAEFADDTGFMHLATIPVDAFNRAIWNDVGGRPNPFGTKSPWGDDSQPLSTPPNVASFASGIVAGAGAATGQSRVSPLQVAATAGLAAGKGYLAGMAVGKVFGALAGLRPEAQQQLQRTGMWAGLLTGAVHSLFH